MQHIANLVPTGFRCMLPINRRNLLLSAASISAASLGACSKKQPQNTKQSITSPQGNFKIDLSDTWAYDGYTETFSRHWMRIWVKSNPTKADFSARARLIGGVLPPGARVRSLADAEDTVPRENLRTFSEDAMGHAMSIMAHDYRTTMFENGFVGYSARQWFGTEPHALDIRLLMRGSEYLFVYMMIAADYVPQSASILKDFESHLHAQVEVK